MTAEFQEGLLQYLFQYREAKLYAKYLEKEIFDDPYQGEIFGIWKDYVTRYGIIPSKSNATQFFEDEWALVKGESKTEKNKKIMFNILMKSYSKLADDTEYIVDQIILYAQKKLTRRLMVKVADKIPTASSKLFDNLHRELGKIAKLRERASTTDVNEGHFYIAEPEKQITNDKLRVMPTQYESLNRMTAARGFYAPQLIVFLKGPKAFGTGLLLNLAAWYLKRGEKVYYMDTENGLHDIYTRLDMALLNCEYHELPMYKKELAAIKAQIAKRGGEFKAHLYTMGSTLQDADDKLEELGAKGFKPTLLFNDYIDKFQPTDRSIRENNLKTQHTYNHQIDLNVKYSCPCFTITPVIASAFKNAVLRADDMGADKYKAYNCHAAFALCTTDEEVKAGTMHLIPVVQRAGTAFKYNAQTTCALKVDHERMYIEELDAEAYLQAHDGLYNNPDGNERKKQKPRFIDTKTLKEVKDE